MGSQLPKEMNRGLIALLHKGEPTDLLTNYSPITLLNVSYKIMAKALQKRLQLVLPDLFDEDQTTFLPMRYILDNVLMQTETIKWCKQSDQDLILLKLDFRKAYNIVSPPFMF